MAKQLPVEIGDGATFRKTIGETDVYLFAGITGDFAPNHVDEQYMNTTPHKTRQAHGALMVGYMSTVSSMVTARIRDYPDLVVSGGYDRIRFIKPVFFGDTITVNYEIDSVDHEGDRATGKIEIYNQHGELTTVGTHILRWVPPES